MATDIIRVYESIFHLQGISTFFLSPPYSNLNKIDYGFRKKLNKEFDYNQFLTLTNRLSAENPILIFQDDFDLEYCLVQFPAEYSRMHGAKFYLIGPMIFKNISSVDVYEVIERHHLPNSLYDEVMEFYNRVPYLISQEFTISIVNPLLHELWGEDILLQFDNIESSSIADLNVDETPASYINIEERYAAENELLVAVRSGNLAEAMEAHARFKKFKISPRTSDSLRQKKNMILILNTLLRKTIESAHIHPYYIDRISTEFSKKIEHSTSETQLDSLCFQMIRKYCLLVHNYSTQNYSALIEKCVYAIQFRYAEPLSLEILAEEFAVSTSYLSSLFHKETGKTLTSYINETRVERSLFLLNTTALSVQEIAMQCGYTDANYFTRTFKKLKGYTPMEYRKSIQ